GSFIIGVTGLHDILYQANLIRSQVGELTPIGLTIFMLLLFLLMADRASKAYREVQSLSKELAEKLKLEQDLTERLYALDKLKDEFLTNTSHELRAPLNGIINITQSVIQGIGGQINQIQRQNLEFVLNSSKKLHVIINDLLDVSLLGSGGIRINPAPLDIQTLIGNMLVVFQHLNKNDALILNNEIPSDFPLIFADEARMRQILNNLLGNALKFTESGVITISASHDGEWARICIEDSGSGISPEDLNNIFNAFEQVDGTVQRKYEGAGLGLYITRQLVELLGGKIWITSEPGKGTQAYFTIPLSAEQHTAYPVPVLSSQEEMNALDFLKLEPGENEVPYSILAVDDDLPSLQALMNILHLANYHVRGVSNGKDALNLLENGVSFELVILDVMMPELSGFEVLGALREKYTRLELPVLMLTSKSQSEDMSLCFKLGANDYLTKPFEVDELMARVNSLVRLKKAVNKLITTEMSFLQAQIKPHFIHNALSVISSLSIKDPHKAKALILDLSDYLRGSFDLNNDEGLTTLSKELELVRAYLSIEQARFKERLQVHYHLLEDVDCTLPLLTIQPLVENAIRHGIICRMEGGEIHITASLEPDRVRIEVRDNGVGIESERITKFFELKQDQRGVGMANIHRRLMTHYGEGLHIESLPNQGTVIYFYVPYNSGKEVLE
ncbi:MAG TPA: ATP-binding protein, partial [Anaerovoracaceae bacterium]|nr:ATP-binding protein [Anaerovoracaceae bacterium]